MSAAKAPACPICAKPRAERYRPFCSKRCADIDLGRWFNGSYAIPAETGPDMEGPGLGSSDRVNPDMPKS